MIALRPAVSGDAPEFARILGDWIAMTPWMPRLHTPDGDLRHMTRVIAETEMTVAHDGARILGFMSREGEEVEKLYVDALARRRGVGKALIDHAKAQVDRLGLFTFQANTGARRFYAREGFREDRLTDGSNNEEQLPDVYLVWERAAA